MQINATVSERLDRVRVELARGDVSGMSDLLHGLNAVRTESSVAAWRAECDRAIPFHAATGLLHLEPLTKRAFEKPGGIVADALMTDMALESLLPHSERGSLANRLHRWMFEQQLSVGLRARRSLIAQAIDRKAAYTTHARVLAVDGGHLRELRLSLAVMGNLVEQVVALDNHEATRRTVQAVYAAQRVLPLECSVASLLDNSLDAGTFDFIYVPELLHFLPDRTAAKLIHNLFRRLRPAGQLLLINFAPTLPDIGYMECVMQWYWRYRSQPVLRALTAGIPHQNIAECIEWTDASGNVLLLSLTRAWRVTQTE